MPDDKLSVLLVVGEEDEYIKIRDQLGEIEDTQMDVEWAPFYDAALQMMAAGGYDMFVLDYHLGERNGLELLQEARTNGYDAPAIILTAPGQQSANLRAMKIGSTSYLVKSHIDSSTLKRAIRYALERRRALPPPQDPSKYDELTGLYNHQEMKRLLKEEVRRSLRHSLPMALVILEADNLKVVNDNYGQHTADTVLKWVVRLLRSNVRPADLLARYAGQKLAVILPETSARQAFILAERLRLAVAVKPFTIVREDRRPLQIPVTISLGVASIPGAANTADDLITAVAWALHRAQHQGRNCTVEFLEDAPTKPLPSAGGPRTKPLSE
jgi:two-component system, cell cycle response regulator